MTVIAWDGKTLAGDRLTQWGTTPTRIKTKVFRMKDGRLYGMSGRMDEGRNVLDWLNNPAMPRPRTDKDSFESMVIDKQRRVWVIQEELELWRVESKQWAVGCGNEYALGAMRAGASAVEAVRIASLLTTDCGAGVTWLEL